MSTCKRMVKKIINCVYIKTFFMETICVKWSKNPIFIYICASNIPISCLAKLLQQGYCVGVAQHYPFPIEYSSDRQVCQ